MKKKITLATGSCRYCKKDGVIDYKDVELLKKFITPHGKIQSRKMAGTCASCHRKATRAIKRARIMSLLPFPGCKVVGF